MQANILLLVTDDQRHDTIRALGNSEIHTPTMDALCAAGTAFTHAHIQGGTCGAVCMPSRAMLHTGLGLMRFADAGAQLPAHRPTLGSSFRAAGYRSFACGKWHNGEAAFQRSVDDGAALFFGGMADHWHVPMHRYQPDGVYDDRSRDDRPGQHSSAIIADAAIDFIEAQREQPQPWLATVSFLAPHDPRTMPQWFRDLYQAERIRLPDNYLPVHPFDNGELEIRDEQLEAWPRRPQAIRDHLADYYAMISHLDFQIGRILDALNASGQRQQTIIVLVGDNGLALGSHGLMGKQNCYDHSMRVPLIMAGPGIPTNTRRHQLCYLFDILPTLCDLCAVPSPSAIDGRSLTPTFADPQHRHRDCLHTAYRDCQRAVREQRWKLIRYQVDGQIREQLFDLETDPAEIDDRSADPACAAIRAGLQRRLADWRDRWGDELPWGQRFWSADQPVGSSDIGPAAASSAAGAGAGAAGRVLM